MIEELNDVREEIEETLESIEFLQLVRDWKLCLLLDVKCMIAPKLKGGVSLITL